MPLSGRPTPEERRKIAKHKAQKKRLKRARQVARQDAKKANESWISRFFK